jgi:hypothetical protein
MLALASATVLGVTLSASGGRAAGGGATGAGGVDPTISLRIPDEMAPAGGLVQMKVLTTEATPISGGRPGFGFNSMFNAAGFGMFATSDLAGAAVIDNQHVTVSYTTSGALTANYPILTVALTVRPDAPTGTRTLFDMDPGSTWNETAAGPVYAKPIPPATVTVGGTASIIDVVPGEGVWPAGTIVSVRGMGFNSRSNIRINDAAVKVVNIVSPTELQFALTQATQMRGLKITVQNPENTDTYYSYMRGIVSTVSSRTLLAVTEPIFAVTPRTIATFPASTSLFANQYEAVALQNPNPDAVAVNVRLYAADGSIITQAARTLASRERIALELLELFDGVAPLEGSYVMVTASAPIDAIWLLCDEGTWTVSPSLPLESPR